MAFEICQHQNCIPPRKKIEREVHIQAPKEANTNKIWRLQICAHGLADASRYWCLQVKKELFKPGASISSTDPGIFFWKENNTLADTLICHVDDIVYGGTNKFEIEIISKLKQTFKFDTKDVVTFTYIGTELTQHAVFTFSMSQKNYSNSISEISFSKE